MTEDGTTLPCGCRLFPKQFRSGLVSHEGGMLQKPCPDHEAMYDQMEDEAFREIDRLEGWNQTTEENA